MQQWIFYDQQQQVILLGFTYSFSDGLLFIVGWAASKTFSVENSFQ